MRPKPKWHPQGGYKVYEDMMREWIADAMQDAAGRIELAVEILNRPRPSLWDRLRRAKSRTS